MAKKTETILEWDLIIPFKDRRQFLDAEAMYCQVELHNFYNLSGDEKEKFRDKILKKRQTFLKKWIKDHKIKIGK